MSARQNVGNVSPPERDLRPKSTQTKHYSALSLKVLNAKKATLGSVTEQQSLPVSELEWSSPQKLLPSYFLKAIGIHDFHSVFHLDGIRVGVFFPSFPIATLAQESLYFAF